jgi:hypothetical protein
MSGQTVPVPEPTGPVVRHGRLLTRSAVLLALLLSALMTAAPAHADEGLTVESRSRYVLDPDAHAVTGTMTMTLRNVSPDETTADGSIRYFFYDTYGVPLPARATEVRASSAGEPLRTESRRIDGDDGYRLVRIRFPDLRYDDERTIELSFVLEGQPPRSEDPTRIGEGYATFPVFGPGDPGRNTVEVVVPEDLTVDSTASSLTAEPGDGGTTVYTTREDNLGPGIAATMSVRGETVGVERSVTVGGVPLVLVPYPNDPEWADFIEDRADVGLPVLVDLLGQEWPGDIDRIREDSGNQVRGFEGWYSSRDREIVLGEALDDGVLFHELAHAWVNSSTVEHRWLSEGLAEVIAEETARRTEGSFTVPPQVSPDATAAVPLQTWEDSPGFRSTAVDQWAYPASYHLVAALLEDLAEDRLSALLTDVATATSPWDLPGQRSLSGGALGTGTFLDLLDAHQVPAAADGGHVELYRTWVLDEEGVDRLEGRAGARDSYAAFDTSSPWGLPLGIRRAMAEWEYDQAVGLMTEWAELPLAATALEELAAEVGVGLPNRVQDSYQDADTASELQAAAASIATAHNALQHYAEARTAASGAQENPWGRLGAAILRLDETALAARDNLTAGDFAASVAASELALERAAWAPRLGLAVVAGAVVLLTLVLVVVVRIVRRARRRTAAILDA